MKRYIAALGVAALAGSAVIGSAAALGVDGGVVQSGVDGTLTCDNDGVVIMQRSEFDTTEPFSVGPNIEDVDEACAGENIVVTVFDSGGNQIGQSTNIGVVPNTSGRVTGVQWDEGDIPLTDIYRVVTTIVS